MSLSTLSFNADRERPAVLHRQPRRFRRRRPRRRGRRSAGILARDPDRCGDGRPPAACLAPTDRRPTVTPTVQVAVFEAPVPFSVAFTGDDIDPAAVVAAAEAVLAGPPPTRRTASDRRRDDRLDLPGCRDGPTPSPAPPAGWRRRCATASGTPARSNDELSPPARAIPTDVRVEYTPHLDGDPDPGEVVWAWVPFEDDPTLGKDRPVVIIGRHGAALSGVALTSKDRGRLGRRRHRRLGLATTSQLRQGRPPPRPRPSTPCARRVDPQPPPVRPGRRRRRPPPHVVR